MFLWGGVAVALAFCKSTGALAGARVALGVCESGFAPGVLLLLSCWYRKQELSRRVSHKSLSWHRTPLFLVDEDVMLTAVHSILAWNPSQWHGRGYPGRCDH